MTRTIKNTTLHFELMWQNLFFNQVITEMLESKNKEVVNYAKDLMYYLKG